MLKLEDTTRALSDEEIDRFWHDGAIIVRNLYSAKWIETVRAALDELCAGKAGPAGSQENPAFRAEAYTWHTNDRVRDFALFSPTAHVAQQVLRSKRINLFCDQIFVKQAYNDEKTPWHHDLPFFPLSGEQFASVWTSVDPVRTEESALEFVSGSHLWAQRFRPLGVGGVVKSVAPLGAAPDLDNQRDTYRILSWDMEPGDAVVFHGLTLHGSRGRPAGDRHRRAIATRWCGDDVRYTPTGMELEIAWKHGLQHGDPIGGPIFPQILPHIMEDEVSDRLKSAIPPNPEIVARNTALARRFKKVSV